MQPVIQRYALSVTFNSQNAAQKLGTREGSLRASSQDFLEPEKFILPIATIFSNKRTEPP